MRKIDGDEGDAIYIMKKVVINILLTAFFFGTMEVALKIGGSSLDAVQMTFLRFFIGALVLLPVGYSELKKRGTVLNLRDYSWLFLVGLMGVAISMLAFQFGVMNCNASTAAALISLNPLFTMLIAHLFTSEKMNRAKWLACGVGLVAGVFLIRPWDLQPGNTPLGLGLMLFASVTFAAYTVMGKVTIARIGATAQTGISFLFGSVILWMVLLATGRPVFEGVIENWAIVAYAGIVVTGIGYLCYFTAIRYSDATTGAIAFYIKPAIAPILAMIFLREQIYWNTVVGILLLMSASVITLRDAWRAKQLNIEEVHEIDAIFSKHTPHAADKRRYFATMLPIMEIDDKDHFILEVRNQGVVHQKGEICFPGGEMNMDEAPEDCALRETCEELGVARRMLKVINQIDTYHGLSGMKVYSFVGRLQPTTFDPDPRAVQCLITIPVEFFLNHNPEDHLVDVVHRDHQGDHLREEIEEMIETNYQWPESSREMPVYHYEGHVIWGITAILLKDFANIVNDAKR